MTLRTSKFITNRLLNRKQFVVTVLHPTRPNLSRSELGEKLAALYKSDKARVVVFGLKTKFGGGSSQGFGLVYDDEESQKKFEPRYRLVRVSRVLPSGPRAWEEECAEIDVRGEIEWLSAQGGEGVAQAPQGTQEQVEEGQSVGLCRAVDL